MDGAADGLQHLLADGWIGRQHFRDGGQRAVAVEQQGEELLAQDLLELNQRQAAVLGTNQAKFVECTLIHPRPGRADINQAADCRFASATLGDPGFELGDALLDKFDSFRFQTGARARILVLAPQSDQRLQQRRTVDRQEDFLHAAVAQIAICLLYTSRCV